MSMFLKVPRDRQFSSRGDLVEVELHPDRVTMSDFMGAGQYDLHYPSKDPFELQSLFCDLALEDWDEDQLRLWGFR